MADNPRIKNKQIAAKIMTAEAAAALIPENANIGMSGFTGAGYPKAVPVALAKRIMDERLKGKKFKVGVFTGASTAPELDGALAMVDGISLRVPYQSDPIQRDKINSGAQEYMDMHLSHVPLHARQGFYGPMHVALVEVTRVKEDGSLVLSSSVGNSVTWLQIADKIILEVNTWQDERLEGMHDILAYDEPLGSRKPIPIVKADDRPGTTTVKIDPAKVVAVVETNLTDRNAPFSPPDADSNKIAENILEFLENEVKKGRLPPNLTPLQSGVGNIANAVLVGLNKGKFENLYSYTEVIQDGMLDLLDSGKLKVASATAFSVSPEGQKRFNDKIDYYRSRIILRPQEISNHPEVIRRLGTIAMNGMIEADIYGHVNSTHVMGTKMQNGIGGSGDFARNSWVSIFMTPSLAKNGAISCIVPMSSHIDHTEHDVGVIVTEQGLADLRGKSPKQRAQLIIEKCAHPDFKPLLKEYYKKAMLDSPGKQSPHILDDAFNFHTRFLKTGSMRA